MAAALGVNIDHVATIREARKTTEPDPVRAAVLAELAGADGITVHLREDRRHIQDRDVRMLRKTITTRLNLEMAAVEEIIHIARDIGPDQATLVPENRDEITTEGGLDVRNGHAHIEKTVQDLHSAGIPVSLFIDPEKEQIEASADTGAEYVELHTGTYAEAAAGDDRKRELCRLIEAAEYAAQQGIGLNIGHGLTYINTPALCTLPGLHEMNIGHSIISRAVLTGIDEAVRSMKELIRTHETSV